MDFCQQLACKLMKKDVFYFIANSQLTDYDKDGEIFPLSELEETQVLKIKLK